MDVAEPQPLTLAALMGGVGCGRTKWLRICSRSGICERTKGSGGYFLAPFFKVGAEYLL